MKKYLIDPLKNGCVIFTVITVISYTFGMIISTGDKAFIPSLSSIYLYLGLSLILGFANKLLTNEKMNMALRLILHFLVCGILFFCVIVLGGGLAESGFATLIAMTTFTVLYAIIGSIYGVIRSKKERNRNSKKEYTGVFS